MTPQQIAAIERHLAEVVMGWHVGETIVIGIPGVAMMRKIWCGCADGKHKGPEWGPLAPPNDGWHPLKQTAQAATVRGIMAKKQYRIDLDIRDGSAFATIWRREDRDNMEVWAVCADYTAPTESEASSVAAALATGYKLEATNG